MKAPHSIGTPVRCWISAIGLMSATIVRAAQLARIFRRPSAIARASRSTSRATLRPGAGQADVGGVDAERVHVVQDLDLLVDRRRPHRRRLQPVAQRLVVEHRDRLARPAATASWFQS